MPKPAAEEADPVYAPLPPSLWQLEAKDITCLRTLLGADAGKPPQRISLPTVLAILSGACGFTREDAETILRHGRAVLSDKASYIIAPEHLLTAATRKAT